MGRENAVPGCDVNAGFNGPVQQVAGRDVNIAYYGPSVPAPDPDAPDQATRECPQCKSRTWAYNTHCHHCQLDMRAFDRRKAWRSMSLAKYLMGGLVVIGAVAFAAKAHAEEFEIVRVNPGDKSASPPLKHPVPAAAKAFADELVSVQDGFALALMNVNAWPAFTMRVNGLSTRATSVFGSARIDRQFYRCHEAAQLLPNVWADARSMSSAAAAPQASRISGLVSSSTRLGDAYRICREEINALTR
jgi:hypothetical protein